MMRTRKKRKKRSGSHVAYLLVLLLVLTPANIFAKKEKKRSAAEEPFALIAGTVFRPPGFAIAGAEVTLTPETDGSSGVKLKKTKAVTNSRGEFAMRVPPVPSRYRVDVQNEGYEPQQKLVSVEGEQRQDLTFLLSPAGTTDGGIK